MGGFDFAGVGQGLGDVGQEVAGAVQRQRARIKGEKEEAEQKAEEKKRKRLEAARQNLAILSGVGKRNPADPAYQAALQELQTAHQDFYGSPLQLQKRRVGARPEKRVILQGPQTPLERFRAGERGEDITQFPREVVTEPGVPGQEILSTGAEEDEEGLEGQALDRAAILAAQIGASSGEARKLASDRLRAYISTLPEAIRAKIIAQYDPDRVAARFTLEDERERQQAIAGAGLRSWQQERVRLANALQQARQSGNPNVLIAAIAQWNSNVVAGKRAGYISAGAIDPIQELSKFAITLRDPAQMIVLFPALAQYGIKPTPQQKQLMDIYLQQKKKAAAPRVPGRGRKKPIVEETGL